MFIPSVGYSVRVRSKTKSPSLSGHARSGSRRKKSKSQNPDRSPEQDLIWQALQSIFQIRAHLEDYHSHFQRLRQILGRALDLKFSDNDRRLMNKQYQGVLKMLSDFVQRTEFKGARIFDKKDPNAKLGLALDSAGYEVMTVDVSGLDLESLKLKDTRLDSIVYARKLEKQVKLIEQKLTDMFKLLDDKDAALDIKRQKLGMPIPEFLVGGAAAPVKDFEEEVEEILEAQSAFLNDLKDRQKRAAAAKGRSFALLINLKG